MTLYTADSGAITGEAFYKSCTDCGVKHYYQHYEPDGAKYMYSDWDSLDYFISSPSVVLETKLMRRLNIDVLVLSAAYRCLAINAQCLHHHLCV